MAPGLLFIAIPPVKPQGTLGKQRLLQHTPGFYDQKYLQWVYYDRYDAGWWFQHVSTIVHSRTGMMIPIDFHVTGVQTTHQKNHSINWPLV